MHWLGVIGRRARLPPNMQTASRLQSPLLAALTEPLRLLATRGIVRSYPKKAVLINEGEKGDSLYILVKGCVKAFSMDEDGREITYSIIQAGDYFGEMSLDGGPRSASVITLEASTCCVVSRAEVEEHLVAYPEFAMNILGQVIRRARIATEAARNMALLDVYGRLVAILEKYDGPSTRNPDDSVTLDAITHQEIASRVGASREMVSRLLKDLQRGGYVRMATKQIVLLRKLPARW